MLIVGTLGRGFHYLLVYWASGPSQGLGVVQGGKIFDRRDCVSE